MESERSNPDVGTIAAIAPTLCGLFGVSPPSLSEAEPLEEVLQAARCKGIVQVKRCLIYIPDAVGTGLYRQYQHLFSAATRIAPIEVALHSVVPPKTPVCCASMFTGAPPESHGIQGYVKRVLDCDTAFDALGRRGKKMAIVTVVDSSMDVLFRKREIVYFPELYDGEVTERVLGLVEADRHDLIVAYHQEYDDVLHKQDPHSSEAIAALQRHAESFVRMSRACESIWRDRAWAIIFAPDHGAHTDPVTGQGTHGENIPEDMMVTHLFGIRGEGASAPP